MNAQQLDIGDHLIIDSFAGGGGVSTGIEMAFGRSPDIAINHNEKAVAMHAANHPNTRHFCKSIYHIDPDDIMREYKTPIALAWFSPDCTHHSRARGGVPRKKHIRDLAWIVVHWAQRAKPNVIIVENVGEFKDWGKLDENNMPCPLDKGMEFARWIKALKKEGYKVQWRELSACDYGAPTTRKRLFIVARRDGQPITWPEKTHGEGREHPYRTAAECIDWSIPCPSIFERKKDLAENTQRRIARGIMKYVVNSVKPFIIPIAHYNGSNPVYDSDKPINTITATPKGGSLAVVAPSVTTYYGDKRPSDARGAHLENPLHTITTENRHGLVAAFMAQHNGGFYKGAGKAADTPVSTITTTGSQQGIVASHIMKMRGTNLGHAIDEPLHTISAGGTHHAEVRSFLIKYYGNDGDLSLKQPLHTITGKDRFGLITVNDQDYIIVDIGMRMFQPRELYNAQGFPPDYIIDRDANGNKFTKAEQVFFCGNSVCPPQAEAIISSNMQHYTAHLNQSPTPRKQSCKKYQKLLNPPKMTDVSPKKTSVHLNQLTKIGWHSETEENAAPRWRYTKNKTKRANNMAQDIVTMIVNMQDINHHDYHPNAAKTLKSLVGRITILCGEVHCISADKRISKRFVEITKIQIEKIDKIIDKGHDDDKC